MNVVTMEIPLCYSPCDSVFNIDPMISHLSTFAVKLSLSISSQGTGNALTAIYRVSQNERRCFHGGQQRCEFKRAFVTPDNVALT